MIDATSSPEEIEKARRTHHEMLREDERMEIERHGNYGGRLHPTGWRDRIALDFSQCDHTSLKLVEVKAVRFEVSERWREGVPGEEIELGIWGMEICTRCGTQVRKECPHEKTEWLFDGKLLVCLNCGVDCT